jgi:choline dehydrogenase-like flavoprotein
MILFPKSIAEGTVFEADLCIIGAGPAGISVALELLPTQKKIVVLAGGNYKETREYRELNKGLVFPKGSHEPLEERRRRAFGGTSLAWGGRCIPFDSIDFEKRDWIPYSGWPFSYDSMKPFYEKAMKLCKAGSFTFDTDEVFPGDNGEIIQGIDNDEVTSKKIERWSPSVNFGKEYRNVLDSADHVKVLMETNLIQICTESEKENVSSIIASAKDKKITVRAKNYVLACGGIESPRLLLSSSNKFHPNGIGNDHDAVGRYYMSHLTGIHAEIAPSSRNKMRFHFEKDADGVPCRRRWWVTESAQKTKKIGNVIFYLFRNSEREPLFSAVYLTKFALSITSFRSFKKIRNKWSMDKKKVVSNGTTVLTDGWRLIPIISRFAIQRFSKRKLPFLLPSVHSRSFGLFFQTEQMPNPDSRITISKTDFDYLGVPRAVAQIAFTDLDKKTIIEAHKIFIERYMKADAGNYELDFEKLSKFVNNRLQVFNSSSHHIGTTRISEDSSLGVVDANCKVHGMNNLFIAGSSVFPTGGHANPTLTIVALAIKLAIFLKDA